MNKIEQVARAMYSNYDWGCNHGMKDVMHNCAKLAIEAMREPSRAMYDSSGLNQIIDYHTFSRAWNNGIDAALKEE